MKKTEFEHNSLLFEIIVRNSLELQFAEIKRFTGSDKGWSNTEQFSTF